MGTPVAGRNRVETEGLIGFFVNTVVMRAEVRRGEVRGVVEEGEGGGDGGVREPGGAVREGGGGGEAGRDLSHTPVVQVTLALQNAAASGVRGK